MIVKPRDNMKVYDPESGDWLPEEGVEREGSYWQRRIADGDVIEIKEEKPESQPESKKENKKGK